MAHWLVKSDPDEYSWDDLERDGRTVWDGVSNALALQHVRKIKRGDAILIYHSGADRALVGIAQAASDSYPDNQDASGRLAVFDIEPVRRLARPVPLAAIKSEARFADFELVRMGRLSVMPVAPERWRQLLEMAGEK